MAREVTCVTKDTGSSYDDCRCIKRIGYKIGSSSYSGTPSKIHDDINNGKSYYVTNNGTRTDLIAAKHGLTKYVRTEPNDTPNDNLLKQPSC
ncbi:DUF3892 domain-containing protein [Haladaptatus sp. SPP-AMP-3]|uniref:DUF3892 domain-containing protein n=1 Tax=Haladaptatus sp. SPP-AMP-3 TaxID=3121295 RepID=UPI003C2C6EFD